MQHLLDGLVAVNSSAKADVTKTREDRLREGAKADANREYEALHPVVRTHPETGRKALYVNGGHTVRFKDMTEAESAPLLQYLFAHQQRPEFTCRFRWASRLDRLLGQPVHPAQPDQRLPWPSPCHAPGNPGRRPAALTHPRWSAAAARQDESFTLSLRNADVVVVSRFHAKTGTEASHRHRPLPAPTAPPWPPSKAQWCLDAAKASRSSFALARLLHLQRFREMGRGAADTDTVKEVQIPIADGVAWANQDVARYGGSGCAYVRRIDRVSLQRGEPN